MFHGYKSFEKAFVKEFEDGMKLVLNKVQKRYYFVLIHFTHSHCGCARNRKKQDTSRDKLHDTVKNKAIELIGKLKAKYWDQWVICWEDLYQDNGDLEAHSQEIILKLWVKATDEHLKNCLDPFKQN